MAVIHKLTTRLRDGTLIEADFTSDRFLLLHGDHGYVPVLAQFSLRVPYVSVTLPLKMTAASDNDLATSLQTLELLQRQAEEYWNLPTQRAPVWYHQRLENEAGERRAFVKSISVGMRRSWFDPPAPQVFAYVDVTIERYGSWEAASPVTVSTVNQAYFNPMDVLNGGSLPGTQPGRIAKMSLAAGIGHFAKFWGGFRSEHRHGNLEAFINKWECEEGTNDTDAADVSDSTASGGSSVRVTPSAESWDGVWNKALQISLLDVREDGSDLQPQYGEFLWLLRAKVSEGTWWVKLRWLYGVIDPVHEEATDVEEGYADGLIIQMSSTDWQIYEAGVMPIPLHDTKAMADHEYSSFSIAYRIDVYALRDSGSGTLDLDVVYPIPLDEGFLHMDSSQANTQALNLEGLSVGTSPTGELHMTFGYTAVEESVAFDGHEFSLPRGRSRLVYVFQGADASDIDQLADTSIYMYNLECYPRWRSLRGGS